MTKIQVNSQGKAYLTTAGKALAGVQPTLVTKSITENGTYNASSDNADGYSSVTVNVSGGGGSKYGLTIDNMLGDVNSSGVLQHPVAPSGDIVFTGVKDIGRYILAYRFYENTNVTGVVSFPDLTQLTSSHSLYAMMYSTECTSFLAPNLETISGPSSMARALALTKITSLTLPKLKTVSTSSALEGLCSGCLQLSSVYLPELESLSGISSANAIFQNTSITTVSFPKLYDVSGNGCLMSSFKGTKLLTSIYFNSLTTTSFGSFLNQFSNMFSSNTASTSGAFTMHFPSNLSSTISGLTGYPNFGATAGILTLAFDLPATT